MGYFTGFLFSCQPCYAFNMGLKLTKSSVISAVLLLSSASFVAGTVRIAQKGTRLVEAKKELAALEQKRALLEKEALYRESPEFVEEEARNKLNMVKPGEEVYLRPKILGDDLLGAQDGRAGGADTASGFFAPVTAKIDGLVDKIRDLLLLFQN